MSQASRVATGVEAGVRQRARPGLIVRVLGPLDVSVDGAAVPVGQGRQRAALILLFLHAGEVVSSDHLIDDLWGERPPPTAAKILQGYISALRRVLPEGSIETRGSGYVLRAAGSDRDEFERLLAAAREQSPREAVRTLRAALDLWRGPPLADVEYDAWAQPEIARLEELRLVAVEERIAAALEMGARAQLVPELEALVAAHPLRERLRAFLMLALYRSGRQADALGVYANARSRFLDELGIEPGPDLREMQRRILEQDPELAPKAVPVPLAVRRAPWLVVAGGVLLAASAAAAALLLSRGGAGALLAAPNSVGVIDPATNRLVRVIGVGETPHAVAVGSGSIWVLNSDEETLSRIDPSTRAVVDTIGSGTQPTSLATGAGAVWVSDGMLLRRIDPGSGAVSTTSIRRAPGAEGGGPGWIGGNSTSVWATAAGTLARVRPLPALDVAPSRAPCCGPVALGAGSVWTTDATGLVRIDASSGVRLAFVLLPFLAQDVSGTTPLAVGYGSVWVVDVGESSVWRIDATTNRLIGTIAVGRQPSGIAVGAGAVWVASADGSVSRIDPAAGQGLGQVVATIRVGGTPSGLAVGGSAVWVAVD